MSIKLTTNLVRNNLTKFIGHGRLSLPRADWGGLRGYGNDVFRVSIDYERGRVNFHPRFYDMNNVPDELLIAHKYLDGGVNLSCQLEIDDDDSDIMYIDSDKNNIPIEWLNDIARHTGSRTCSKVDGVSSEEVFGPDAEYSLKFTEPLQEDDIVIDITDLVEDALTEEMRDIIADIESSLYERRR